jgi:hypothetical protein
MNIGRPSSFFPAKKETRERGRAAATATTAMASGGMKREISETHDALRFGINPGVKADLAPPHPLQAAIQSVQTPPLFCFPSLSPSCSKP